MNGASLFLLGIGGVGNSFLKQLSGLGSDIKFRLAGIADSKNYILDEQTSLQDYQKIVLKRSLSSHPQSLPNKDLGELAKSVLSLNQNNLLIVDATAGETGLFWNKIIDGGAAVVTANKKPLAGPYEECKKFYLTRNFRYEATVGGGLPIISTIKRLRASGDEIIDIRGLLSGTLSYIMNEVSSGKLFSEAVSEAHKLGYTEPDPRDDLSGADVKRKALILARALGAELPSELVQSESLVPDGLKEAPIKEFLENLREEDYKYKRNEKLGYAVTATPFGARVAIEPLASGDPLATLSGPENMAVIRTKRYFRHPLIIRGPGAGAEVTAQGMMGDILRLLGAL